MGIRSSEPMHTEGIGEVEIKSSTPMHVGGEVVFRSSRSGV